MLAVSVVLFIGITLIAYMFGHTAQIYFDFYMSPELHMGIALLVGLIVSFSSVGIYKNHCKRCNETHRSVELSELKRGVGSAR